MTAFARRPRHSVNIWPGFVDALAALLMVVIFLLMVFVVSQFYLREALSSRETALEELGSQISELAELLSLERQTNEDLRLNIQQLSAQLQNATSHSDTLASRVSELDASLQESQSAASALNDDLASARYRISDLETRINETMTTLEEKEKALLALNARFEDSEDSLLEERNLTRRQKDELDLFNQQIAALRQQMAALQEALEASERKDEENKVKISDLGKRLNVALAGKVQELARYRSEFFGRLREVLGDHPDISIVGDRFVFQSEVLFTSGSADLGLEGQDQLAQLADTLKNISAEIPQDIDWILRIDGHTDPVPISNFRYHNNWELSAGRAISVVRYLIGQGIPSNRLAAAGFGEFYPLDPKKDSVANRRNRRIEIKLTQR